MTSGQGEQVVHWAEKALDILADRPAPDALAQAHHLWAAGGLLAGYGFDEAETHLTEAIRLATDNNLPGLAGGGQFELGNLQAQRGDLTEALQSYAEALRLAEAGDDLFQQVLSHNNLAYHTMLAGDLETARRHIESGLTLVEYHSLIIPRQYLLSTRGEIALAEGEFDAAQNWFAQALAEAERNNNQPQIANTRANMGLLARERGNLEQVVLLLEEARAAITGLVAPHLQTKIDLWLAELYFRRGEQSAAKEALNRAETRLAGSERRGLQAWARRVRLMLNHAN